MAVLEPSTTTLDYLLRYDLAPAEIDAATRELFDRFAASISAAKLAGKKRICIAITAFDPLAPLARTVEGLGMARVADNLPPEIMQVEFGPYEDRSLFFLGIDLNAEIVAASMRIITGTTGVGPLVKSVRDALRHPAYNKVDSDDIDLRSDLADVIDLRSREVGAIGSGATVTGSWHRRYIEDFHGMAPGKVVFDIATVSSVRRSLDAAAWTAVLVAASIRASRLVQADYAVTFVTNKMLQTLRRSLHAPWTDLAAKPAVAYFPDDAFLSQPAFANFKIYEEELQQAFALLEAGEKTGKGAMFERVSRLAISPNADCQFHIRNF